MNIWKFAIWNLVQIVTKKIKIQSPENQNSTKNRCYDDSFEIVIIMIITMKIFVVQNIYYFGIAEGQEQTKASAYQVFVTPF